MLIDSYNMKPVVHIGGLISRLNTPYTLNELRHVDPTFKLASEYSNIKTGGSLKSFFKKIGKAIKHKILPKVKSIFDKIRTGAEKAINIPIVKQGLKTIVGAVGSVAGIPPTITSGIVDKVADNLGSFNKMFDEIEKEIGKSGIMSAPDAKTFAKSVVSTIKTVSDQHPEIKEVLADKGKKILQNIKNRVYTKDDKDDLIASAPYLPLVNDESISSEPKKTGEGLKIKVKKIPVKMLRAAGLDKAKYPTTPIKRIVGKGFYLGGKGCSSETKELEPRGKGLTTSEPTAGKLPIKTNKEALEALKKKYKF